LKTVLYSHFSSLSPGLHPQSPAVPAVGDVGRHRWLPEHSGAGVVWIMGNLGGTLKELTFDLCRTDPNERNSASMECAFMGFEKSLAAS